MQVQSRSTGNLVIVAIGEGGAESDEQAIDSTGRGWVWGNNGQGSLCTGNEDQVLTPTLVPDLPPVTASSGGGNHTLWLAADGTGVVRDGARTTRVSWATGPRPMRSSRSRWWDCRGPATRPSRSRRATAPRVCSHQRRRSSHGAAFGDNAFGQLGVGSVGHGRDVATPVRHIAFSSVSFGGSSPRNGQSVGITTSGQAMAWGNDQWGQLGDGNTVEETRPVAVAVPGGVRFTVVVTGGQSSAGLDSTGHVWTWGDNSAGQLGDPGVEPISAVPVEVDSGVRLIQTISSDVADLHRRPTVSNGAS